jgi:hypothetical protein
MDISQPTGDQNLFLFTISHMESGNVQLTGFRFTFSDNSIPVNNGSDQDWTEREVNSGSLTVFGQVKTSAGDTTISKDCSATVNAQTVSQPGPSTTVGSTPNPPAQVLSASVKPLPATGPETALGGVAGLSAIGVATRAYLRSRKSLADSLRNKRK